MPMLPFFTFVGKRAFDEMRTIIVMPGQALPAGPYGFLEFYCTEPGCDCRRVILHVVRPDSGRRVWATINFGWERPEYYRAWARSREMAHEMAEATLEPFGPQTRRSTELLRLFRETLQCDAAYVGRLQRHYAEVKDLCRSHSHDDALPVRPKTKGRSRARGTRNTAPNIGLQPTAAGAIERPPRLKPNR
jgi:hypothetical protein